MLLYCFLNAYDRFFILLFLVCASIYIIYVYITPISITSSIYEKEEYVSNQKQNYLTSTRLWIFQADVVAAMTLEVLKGTSRAFDSDVQAIRPHKGQILVAKRLRALLHSDTYPSQIARKFF